MADGIYLGMAGASARSTQLDAIADALANAQSPGFKAERPAFESFLPKGARGDDTQPSYPAAVSTEVDLSAGAAQTTGNGLDVLPEGGSFLAVRMPSGQTLYTRDGRITVDAQGALHAAGGELLGKGGSPILVPPGITPGIARNGAILAGGVEVDRLATFELHGHVVRAGRALYAPEAALAVDQGVRSGEIELGNFSPLEAAVQMISAQRGFEHGMQVIETYKKISDRSAEVGRVR